MTIDAINFRTEGTLVVLQVHEPNKERYGYGYKHPGKWRDAKVEDLLEVARYTRAYDALDKSIDSLMNTVSSLQQQVGSVLDQNARLADRNWQEK